LKQILLLCEDTSIAQNYNKPKRNRWECDEVAENSTPPAGAPSWCISRYYDPLDSSYSAVDFGAGVGPSGANVSSPGCAPIQALVKPPIQALVMPPIQALVMSPIQELVKVPRYKSW
jgi:hypothetical protein